MIEFIPQPKIPRFNRAIHVTEKIDGTNAAVLVDTDGTVRAASKNRILRPDEPDNHGFRAWVEENQDNLARLGPGLHRGEWWGCGIGKRHPTHAKTFSLFNTDRWGDDAIRPKCCSVVPLLCIAGNVNALGGMVENRLRQLKEHGSIADPACKNPEGIVLYHTASGQSYKITLEHDEGGKSNG